MKEAADGVDTVVVRPRKTMIVAWVCAVVVFALFVVVAVVLRTAETGVFFRLADQIAMAAIGLLIAGGVLLLARPRVRADAAGIEVRNVLVTRTLPWDVVKCPSRGCTVSVRVVTAPNSASGRNSATGLIP